VSTNAAASADPISSTARTWLGLGNVVGCILAFVALVATYGFAEQVMTEQAAAKGGSLVTHVAAWWGPDFPASMGMAVLLVGAAAGMVGSMIQQSRIFAERAGRETLQQTWVWWYVLRPMWSALLGAVVVVALNAGVIQIGDKSSSPAGLTVLVTAGFIAGLFTDRVLDRLRIPLGASDPAHPVRSGATPTKLRSVRPRPQPETRRARNAS
jgi:hypothetical protein